MLRVERVSGADNKLRCAKNRNKLKKQTKVLVNYKISWDCYSARDCIYKSTHAIYFEKSQVDEIFQFQTFAGKPQPILMITAASPHHFSATPFIHQTPLPTNNFYSTVRNGLPQPQFYHQQQQFPYTMTQNPFAFSPIVATAALSPIFHNHHPAMLAFQQQNMYHHPTPVNAFYANPQQFHKIPIYNQQPQTIPAPSLISSFTHHNLPSSFTPSPATSFKHTPAHSKSVATLKTPQSTNANSISVPSFAASHVEHNEGAVSFAHFSTPTAPSSTGDLKKEFSSPLKQQQQPSSYYNSHPQPILSPAYSKLVQYLPSSNTPLHHYSSQNDFPNNVPSYSYAHLSRVIPSSASNPHHSPGLIIGGSSKRAVASSTASPQQGWNIIQLTCSIFLLQMPLSS